MDMRSLAVGEAGPYAWQLDFVQFDQVAGKRVLVVGGRQSAYAR